MGSLLESGFTWISLYFVANLTLTIHNKWVLQKLEFDFPWLLTAVHILLSGIGGYIAVYGFKVCRPAKIDALKDHAVLLAFSVLYTVNIAISNVSLNYVSLSFHQIVRSTNPVFTIGLDGLLYVFGAGAQPPSLIVLLSLVPVVVGVIFATVGEYQTVAFDALGLFLTLLGVFLSAVKGIATNKLMVDTLKLHPLDLLWRMAPVCFLQCLAWSYIVGEWDSLPSYLAVRANRFVSSTNAAGLFDPFAEAITSSGGWWDWLQANDIYWKLALNGSLAFWLNWVSFTANKKTSALSMTVAGNVKQAMSILLAVYIFDIKITLLNGLGILVTLFGGAWYSTLSYKESQAKRRASNTHIHMLDGHKVIRPMVSKSSGLNTSFKSMMPGSASGDPAYQPLVAP